MSAAGDHLTLDHIRRIREALKMDAAGYDTRRFRLVRNEVLFRTRFATKFKPGEREMQWMKIASIPGDLRDYPGIVAAIARAFVANGHKPLLTDGEVRGAVLAAALA